MIVPSLFFEPDCLPRKFLSIGKFDSRNLETTSETHGETVLDVTLNFSVFASMKYTDKKHASLLMSVF